MQSLSIPSPRATYNNPTITGRDAPQIAVRGHGPQARRVMAPGAGSRIRRGRNMCDDPRCGHRLHLSRRGLLAAGAATWLGMQLGPAMAHAAGTPANAIGPDEALKRLVDGNARYAANTAANKDFSAGRAARAESQHPFAAIVSCADSRVAPELAFDQGPGELFVVRVAGNFVNTDGLASLA